MNQDNQKDPTNSNHADSPSTNRNINTWDNFNFNIQQSKTDEIIAAYLIRLACLEFGKYDFPSLSDLLSASSKYISEEETYGVPTPDIRQRHKQLLESFKEYIRSCTPIDEQAQVNAFAPTYPRVATNRFGLTRASLLVELRNSNGEHLFFVSNRLHRAANNLPVAIAVVESLPNEEAPFSYELLTFQPHYQSEINILKSKGNISELDVNAPWILHRIRADICAYVNQSNRHNSSTLESFNSEQVYPDDIEIYEIQERSNDYVSGETFAIKCSLGHFEWICHWSIDKNALISTAFISY